MSDYDVPSDSYDSDDYEDFQDVDDDDDDYEVPINTGKGKAKFTGPEYESLSIEKLQESLDDIIRNVGSMTGLESPIVSILLQHFRWNEDRLLESYTDSSARVLEAAGEPSEKVPPSKFSRPPPNKRAKLTPIEFTCGICFDNPDQEHVYKMRCSHPFCSDCWGMYIESKVKEEGQCFFQCMQEGCKTVVDEPSVAKLVDSACYERFRELVRQSYVTANPNLRFCPHPGCTQAVSCSGGRGSSLLTEVPIVECSESHPFCFGCGLDCDHRPLICKFISRWLKSARDDAGTSQWIKANTRCCPKCQNNIEKNGGCNRILCGHCKFQFCWLCMQKWEVHGYNNEVCNTWKEPEKDESQSAAQQNLEKWLFYFDRYNNHELSAKLDQDLCERTEEKMLEVQKTSQLSWIESKFMQNAVDELTKCRQTLKWSYVMAYFLKPGNQKQIFEDIQADVERAVEDLSQMLEEPVETETVKSLRQRMMDKTGYVRSRHEILLDDTAAGLAEGRWEWFEE